MKTITLCAVMLFTALLSNGQKAITLTQRNIDVEPGKVKDHTPASITGVKLPAIGTNKTWDYSKLKSGSTVTFKNFDSKYKQFSNTAIYDTGHAEPFGSPYESTPVNQVFDENSKGFFYAGDYAIYNFVSAAEITGVASDNITVQAQADIPTATDYIIKYPCTYNNSWSTSYTKTINFTMTISALQGPSGWMWAYFAPADATMGFSFNNMKGTVVEHTTVTNTVVGWGTILTPGPGKSNISNDVLLVRRSVVTTENLYFGNTLVPEDLAEAFGGFQGSTTVNSNTESFYNTGDFEPVMTVDFGADNTWSTIAGITYINERGEGGGCGAVVVNKTGQNGASMSNNDLNIASPAVVSDFSTYPNPIVNGSNLNCRFTKNATENWTLNVTNALGQVVNTVTVSGTGIMNIPVEINNQKGGLFFVNLLNEKGQKAATSKFMVGSSN